MRPHVNDQLAGLDKSLIADVALVRPLSRMNTHVAVQLAAVLKGSPAHVTLVGTLLRVDPSVHLQILLNAKHLVAKLAFERPLSCMRSVVTDLQEEMDRGIFLY